MKTEKELNADILKLTLQIQSSYPELSKFIGEMPVTIPNVEDPQINRKVLKDYYDSLCGLMKKYSENHQEEEH